MQKNQRYVVEGHNFLATVTVDEDIFSNKGDVATNAYMEAATLTLEALFRHGAEDSDTFNLAMKRDTLPKVGVILSVCKDGEIGDKEKLHHVMTEAVATNAGILELVRHFKTADWNA